jgi:hypothetical protein
LKIKSFSDDQKFSSDIFRVIGAGRGFFISWRFSLPASQGRRGITLPLALSALPLQGVQQHWGLVLHTDRDHSRLQSYQLVNSTGQLVDPASRVKSECYDRGRNDHFYFDLRSYRILDHCSKIDLRSYQDHIAVQWSKIRSYLFI